MFPPVLMASPSVKRTSGLKLLFFNNAMIFSCRSRTCSEFVKRFTYVFHGRFLPRWVTHMGGTVSGFTSALRVQAETQFGDIGREPPRSSLVSSFDFLL
jgi:hypothetical protein